MCLILHCILVNKCHDTLLKNSFGHDILTKGQQLVKHWEYLLIETVRDVIDNAVQLSQEEVLEVWVVGLAVLTLLDVC